MRALLVLALIGLCVPLLAIAAWLIVVPLESIETAARAPLQAQGLDLSFKGLGKDPLFGVHADEVTVLRDNTPLIAATGARASLRLRSLIARTPEAAFSARFADGDLKGAAILVNRFVYLKAELTGAELEAMGPVLDQAGIAGAKGRLTASINLGPDGNRIEFTVREAKLRDVMGDRGPVPLGMFNTVRGALKLNQGAAEISSLTMEGKDIYAKATGRVMRDGALDIVLTIMPSAGSPYEQVLGAVLGGSKKGPGLYEIRLKR